MKNENGFITSAFLILLPLFVAVLASITAAYFLFTADSRARQVCRVEVLNAQTTLAKDLNRLIDMNTQAAALRAKRKQAEALAASGQPQAVAALQAVIAEQIAFSAQQRLLLMKARLLSRTAPSVALTKAMASIRKSAFGFAAFDFSAEAINGSAHSAAFDVLPSPPTDLTPNYRPSALFTRNQEMRARWAFDVAKLLPPWLRRLVQAQGLHRRSEGDCSATIEKGRKWEPKMTVARP